MTKYPTSVGFFVLYHLLGMSCFKSLGHKCRCLLDNTANVQPLANNLCPYFPKIFIFNRMRKHYLTSLAFGVCFLVWSCGPTKTQSVTDTSSAAESAATEDSSHIEVSEAELSENLRYLASDELQGRKTGTDGIEKAAVLIEKIFQNSGIKPYFKTYRDSFEVKGVTGFNIIGLKEGSDPQLKDEFIIIGAHYDHLGQGKPVGNDSIANGANDNAAGTVVVLELAKYFAEVDTKRSILFTLYSAEEMGLVGSSFLADRLKGEDLDLYLMFNIEMVGVPLNQKDYTAYLTGFELSNLAEKFNEYSGKKVLGFLPQAKEYQLFRRSDNYPFYNVFNVPAQTISTFDFTNYDYYHHVSDEYEEMNVPFMVQLTKEIIPGITAMANSETREIKMYE